MMPNRFSARIGAKPPGIAGVQEAKTPTNRHKWACNAKCLPRVNTLGRRLGYPKLVTHWDAEQVAAAYRELTTAEPAANGRPR